MNQAAAFKTDCKQSRTVAVQPVKMALQKSSLDVMNAWDQCFHKFTAGAVGNQRIAHS